MFRILKYLKPYILLILITVALLFVQANADLALPDYMSNIVNYGIQQGGVVNAVPLAIRQTQMDRLLAFMSSSDQAFVLANYTLENQASTDYATLVKQYPLIASEPVYVLKDVDQAAISRLNPLMGKVLIVVSGIEQAVADPAKAAALGQSFGFDLSKLPPGVDVFSMLKTCPRPPCRR